MWRGSKKFLVWIASILIITQICNCQSNATRNELPGFWQLKTNNCPEAKASGLILNTTVPTVLHLDLLKHGKIQDPFFGNNHQKLEWVSSCNVTYSINITFQQNNRNQEIVFQGIDTYSTIKLNGKQMVTTNNSFVEYRLKIDKKNIKYGQNNLLQVQIFSTKTKDDQENVRNRMPFVYAHSRKAAYQYSWDWAPYLNTMGIWKRVYLLSYQNVVIDYVWARNREVSEKQAIINFAVALQSESFSSVFKAYRLQVYCNNSMLGSKEVSAKNTYIDILIEQPKLWWPNGFGDPYVYQFQAKLVKNSDNSVVDDKKVVYGIRTVQLDQKNKKNFAFIINGYYVYCKGANYVPPDMFYPRLTNPDYKPAYTIKELLDDAIESNFNMLRVWGGGQYESNEFLQMASRKGIMIFYDFMFSDSIYPSKTNFLMNVQTQITQQIRRTRNYPCLVLWSGNNQIYQGILSWGWNSEKYRTDFKRLFEDTIPAIIRKQNPETPYISSSPVNGVGNGGFQRGGDIHYWGVWAGGALFDSYKTAIGPFNSQFGTQSIPVWQTVINFTDSNNRKYTGPQFQSHQKHNSRFGTLNRYMRTYGHETVNFEMQTYLSGLIQAFGIEIAIIYQRISKPKSYGTLYWQFNDAWPAISWSSIDYFGRWKPLQYMAKRLYPNVALFCADGRVTAVNDNLHPVNVLALIKVQHFNGSVLYSNTVELSLAQNEVKMIQEIKRSDFQQLLKEIVVHTQIISGRQKKMSNTYFFSFFKELLIDPTAKLYVKINEQHHMLILRTNKFIKNLYISSTKQYIKLSDNYFDMIAEKQYKVFLNKKHNFSEIKPTLLFRSYVQTHSDTKIEVIFQ